MRWNKNLPEIQTRLDEINWRLISWEFKGTNPTVKKLICFYHFGWFLPNPSVAFRPRSTTWNASFLDLDWFFEQNSTPLEVFFWNWQWNITIFKGEIHFQNLQMFFFHCHVNFGGGYIKVHKGAAKCIRKMSSGLFFRKLILRFPSPLILRIYQGSLNRKLCFKCQVHEVSSGGSAIYRHI